MISTLKTSFLLIAFLAFAMIPMSAATSMESITTFVKDNTISLFLGSSTDEQLHVQIFDLRGKVLMSEKLISNEINERKYNLKNLPDGKYILEIDDSEKIVTKRFSINRRQITMMAEDVIEKPAIFKQDKTWTLGLLTFGKDAQVVILDEHGRELVSESFNDEISISRKYNLDNLKEGRYILKILVGQKSFYDEMIIS